MFDDPSNGDALRAEQIQASIANLRTDIKPRRTVTRRGQRVRGVFPSLKSHGRATYESRLEYLVLSVLEAASSIHRITTHPYVMRLTRANGTCFNYTPDADLQTANGRVLCEVKGDIYLTTDAQIRRFQDISYCLRIEGVPHFTILSSDLELQSHLLVACQKFLLQRAWPRYGTRASHRPENGHHSASAGNYPLDEVDALIQQLLTRTTAEVLAAVRARKDGSAC